MGLQAMMNVVALGIQEAVQPKPEGLSLQVAIEQVLREHHRHTTRLVQAQGVGRQILRLDPLINETLGRDYGGIVEAIDTEYLMAFIGHCQEDDNSNATINIKLAFFSTLFKHFRTKLKRKWADGHYQAWTKPDIPWLPKTRTVKWWLNPELEEKMVLWLQGCNEHDYADYIRWTTRCGLRVEENLRLQRMHFDFVSLTVTVPGTKTSGAQRTLPLFSEAAQIAMRRFGTKARSDQYLWDFSGRMGTADTDIALACNYTMCREMWNRLRDAHGLHKTPTATLKALRRSFAKYATDNGMPTAILQQYLGHEQIQTTMEYLKLVGGYNLDVMRKWVS